MRSRFQIMSDILLSVRCGLANHDLCSLKCLRNAAEYVDDLNPRVFVMISL